MYREISDQRTQHLHLQLYARVSKQLSLCHYLHTICHPFLSNVFAGSPGTDMNKTEVVCMSNIYLFTDG